MSFYSSTVSVWFSHGWSLIIIPVQGVNRAQRVYTKREKWFTLWRSRKIKMKINHYLGEHNKNGANICLNKHFCISPSYSTYTIAPDVYRYTISLRDIYLITWFTRPNCQCIKHQAMIFVVTAFFTSRTSFNSTSDFYPLILSYFVWGFRISYSLRNILVHGFR